MRAPQHEATTCCHDNKMLRRKKKKAASQRSSGRGKGERVCERRIKKFVNKICMPSEAPAMPGGMQNEVAKG